MKIRTDVGLDLVSGEIDDLEKQEMDWVWDLRRVVHGGDALLPLSG